MSSFDQLNLNDSLLQTLHKIGHTQATPIQTQAIPRILAGKDVIATAQTGTGKTAAYLLPAFEMLINNPRTKKHPRILVLTPTRELAFQVKDAAMNYGRHLRPEIASILGGMPYHAQLKQLAKPLDIIVATPGRLIDHLEQKRLNLSAIEMLVIDEADRMLDMGFIDDVKLIAASLPASRQTLLFTATLDKQVANLANTILNNPERIEVVGKQITLESIDQRLFITDDISHKTKILQHMLANECIQKAIIFTATKRDTDLLAKQLRAEGHDVGALHGDMRQHQRNKTILQLRSGKIYILVATDVAARGIDINDISHVINFDLPKMAEDYVHRIGRTGRAGKSGIAISFASGKEGHLLKQIEKFTQQTIEQHVIPGLAPKYGLSSNKPKQRSRSRTSNQNKSFKGNKAYSAERNYDKSKKHHDFKRDNEHHKKQNDYSKRNHEKPIKQLGHSKRDNENHKKFHEDSRSHEYSKKFHENSRKNHDEGTKRFGFTKRNNDSHKKFDEDSRSHQNPRKFHENSRKNHDDGTRRIGFTKRNNDSHKKFDEDSRSHQNPKKFYENSRKNHDDGTKRIGFTKRNNDSHKKFDEDSRGYKSPKKFHENSRDHESHSKQDQSHKRNSNRSHENSGKKSDFDKSIKATKSNKFSESTSYRKRTSDKMKTENSSRPFKKKPKKD